MTRRKSERRVIDIPLGKGVAEHVDAHNLNQPSMLKAENCVFTKAGSLRKRRGFSGLATSYLPTDTTGLNRIFDRAGHSVMYGHGSITAHSIADAGWHDADNYNAYPAEVEFVHGFSGSHPITSYDCAVGTAAAGDVLCEAWTVDGQCWYRVTDYENNAVIQPPTVAGTIVERCQVIWLEAGDRFLLYGMNTGTELYSCYMTPSSSSFTFSTPARVNNEITTYSVKASDDDTAEAAYLVFIDSADAFMYVAVMDKTGLVTVGPTSMAVSPTGNVDIWPDEANSTLYFMGTVLGASPSVILGSCTTALGSISTATGKLAGSVSNADSSTCAIALTENGEIIAAASYVDASVTEDPSTVLRSGTPSITTSVKPTGRPSTRLPSPQPRRSGRFHGTWYLPSLVRSVVTNLCSFCRTTTCSRTTLSQESCLET